MNSVKTSIAGIVFNFSNASTDIFVSSPARGLKPDYEALDRFELDEKVQDLVKSVNKIKDFELSVDLNRPRMEGTAVEHRRFHVCSLSLELRLSEEQLSLKFSQSSSN